MPCGLPPDLSGLTDKSSHYFCEYCTSVAKCAVKRASGVLDEYRRGGAVRDFWLSQFGKFEKMLNFAALYTLEASRTMRVC